jgi:UDP-GlcNAc:undecaprenyl-phosphate GlcNAc-1-phosphate transferase
MAYYLPILSFLMCLALTPLVRRVAVKNGWVARPREDRWHKTPTALLGGVAIYLSTGLALVILGDFASILPHIFRNSHPAGLPSIGAVIWVGMTFLFLVGLVDDFVRIKPQTKLVAQILVASGVAFLGFRLHWFESLTVDTMVTILWIVGITNAFNLLDNMDGLCAGIGCIAAFTLAFIFEGPRPEAFFVAVILAGVLLAFLTYNFNPASIFMGDCGSLQIGFILAVLSLYFAEIKSPNNLANYAVPVMILLVPIFDTILVSSVRILSGRKASVGGRDHTSHRLVLMGFSEKRAVFFLYSRDSFGSVRVFRQHKR